MVTGPESSGKTTLAQALGTLLACPVVPEFAREYLEGISGKPYNQFDFDQIVAGQFNAERQAELEGHEMLIFDTSVVVLQVWSRRKWGEVHPLVHSRLKVTEDTFFLLCAPDIPWEYDPLREHPEERDLLYLQYLEVLKSWKFPFIEIGGPLHNRLAAASVQIKKWIAGLE